MLFLIVAVMVLLSGCRLTATEIASSAFTVRLRAQTTVVKAPLVLADVADLSGADEALVAQLARTPLGSVTDVRLLSRSEILSMIRSSFPKPDDVLLTGADFARVSLATRAPEAEEIAAILKAHVSSVSQWRQEEIEIRSIDNLKGIDLPQGEIQLRVTSRGMPANFQSALIFMEALLDGKPVRSFWVRADVRVRARVVQLVNPVPYRGVLRAEDLREVLHDIEDLRADYVRTCADAIGSSAKRGLKTGELLNRSWLKENDLVRSGEIVRLLEQSGRVSISALARALQSGKLGDRIKVRNIDFDRAITAVVTGHGEVRVVH